jgi:hypothetical protein
MRYPKIVITVLFLSTAAIAQPPGRPGPPAGASPRPGGPGGPGPGDWIKLLDSNMNQTLEAGEFQEALDRTFAELDRNGNGTIEGPELKRHGQPPQRGMQPPPDRDGTRGPLRPGTARPDDNKRLLPPFFFIRGSEEGGVLTKAQFEAKARAVFAEMDKNGDGTLDKIEGRPPRREDGPAGMSEPGGPPPPPNARFIAAEMRFGDKLVKGQPFSAETVIEDSRRLFDGTTVTKRSSGAIYRDGAGRTRREQTLDVIGGVNIGADQVQLYKLIVINDFVARAQYSLDLNKKVAVRSEIGNEPMPFPAKNTPPGVRSESLGTKNIDGVSVEGTRLIHEIPAGRLGNAKPIEVITENWFSPELQVMVMSRHLDPVAGEHVFRLTNIKRSEPSGDLFAVPAGFKVQGPGRQGNL